MNLELLLSFGVGGLLALVCRPILRWLVRRLAAKSATSPTIYLEPQRAKEILFDLEQKREKTLAEIDHRYADRRSEFLAYVDAQRNAIAAELKRKHDVAAAANGAEKKPPGSD